MKNDNLSSAIESAKQDFVESLTDLLSEIRLEVQSLTAKKRSQINLETLSSIIRKLHNVKSVAGTYELNFIQSAARNLVDHTSFIYDLEGDQLIDLHLALEIIDLLDNYVANLGKVKSQDASDQLSDIITSKKQLRRVLVVEKDEQLISRLKGMLQSKDLSFSVVNDGLEAFSRLLVEEYDLLITDLHTGKLDGPSLIAANRVSSSQNKDIATIMLSVSYFDLLPSVSVPDFFVSKDEKLLEDLSLKIDRALDGEGDETTSEQIDILCLDDDQNIHDLLKISFSSHTINYRQSLNGDDFIKAYKAKKPSLVILDLILDKESGVDVVKRLKEMNTGFDVPVIVLSSLGGELRKELLYDVPFIIGSLSKPFTPKSMGSDVIRMFKQSRRAL